MRDTNGEKRRPRDAVTAQSRPVGRLLDSAGLRSRWAWVSFGTLIYWMAPQSVRLFYPLRMGDLGASDLVIGVAVAGSAVAGLVLAVPSGYLLDRFDSGRVLIVSMVGLAATIGGFVVTTSVLAMAALMFVQGLFQMWVWLVLQEMITRVGHGRQAERQLSLFSLSWGIGLAAGPAAVAWLYAAVGFQMLNVVCFVLILTAAGAGFLVPASLREVEPRPAPNRQTQQRVGMVTALRGSLSNAVVIGVMASSFVNIFVQSLRTSFYPLYLEGRGVSIALIGVLLSCIGVSSLAVRLVLGPLVRRFGFVRLLIWSTWLAVVGVAVTPVTTGPAFLVAAALMIGVGLGANPPITVQLLAGRETTNRGTAVGLRLVANRSAQVVQPLIFGALSVTVGLGVAFPLAGVLLGAATVWTSRRLAGFRDRGRTLATATEP